MAIAEQVLPQEIYQHYKGNRYKILTLACHCDTYEEMVIYQDLANLDKIWVRPLNIFCENVLLADGQLVPRFRYIHPEDL